MNQSPLNKSKKDKFILSLTIPKALQVINDNSPTVTSNNKVKFDTLEMSVYGIVTPSVKIKSKTLNYGTQSIKISTHVTDPHDDIKLDFTVDNEYKNYWVIYKWLDFINDQKKGVFNGDKIVNIIEDQNLPNYSCDFSIYGLDEYENKKIRFDYIGGFPNSLSEIKWDYKDGGDILASVVFSFTKMIPQLIL